MAQAGTVSAGSRRLVAAGLAFLVATQVAFLLRRPGAGLVLAVHGFVLHVVAGKAYGLVPAYFDRELVTSRAPAGQVLLSTPGAAALAAGLALDLDPLATAGAVAWGVGAVVLVGALALTVRDNPTGAETGTGDVDAARRRTDRLANAAMPVAGLYWLAGAAATVAAATGAWPAVGRAVALHLLAAGAAGVTLFAVGFRLLPRFLVATPPRPLVPVVLATGALGPAVLAAGVPAGPLLRVGAVLEATAVVGFAAAYVVLFRRSDRDRVGFVGVLLGVLAGVAGVALGVHMAFAGFPSGAVAAHRRLNVIGFLGLSILGVACVFYPPGVGRFPGASDRTALIGIAALAGGLAVEAGGLLADAGWAVEAGRAVGLGGAVVVAGLLYGLFVQRARQRA